MSMNKGGDVLARGGVKCSFQPAGSSVTQEKWDAIWESADDETKQRSGDANTQTARAAGSRARKTKVGS